MTGCRLRPAACGPTGGRSRGRHRPWDGRECFAARSGYRAALRSADSEVRSRSDTSLSLGCVRSRLGERRQRTWCAVSRLTHTAPVRSGAIRLGFSSRMDHQSRTRRPLSEHTTGRHVNRHIVVSRIEDRICGDSCDARSHSFSVATGSSADATRHSAAGILPIHALGVILMCESYRDNVASSERTAAEPRGKVVTSSIGSREPRRCSV